MFFLSFAEAECFVTVSSVNPVPSFTSLSLYLFGQNFLGMNTVIGISIVEYMFIRLCQQRKGQAVIWFIDFNIIIDVTCPVQHYYCLQAACLNV